MATSSSPRWLPVALATAAVCVAGGWLLVARPASEEKAEAAGAPPADPERAPEPRARRGSGPKPGSEAEDGVAESHDQEEARPVAPAARRSGAGRRPQPGRRGAFLDAADPCEPLDEPDIPASYQRVTEADVTVAWPPELVVHEPTSLAYTVAGLLREAANATGTDARERLTVFLYGSRDELHLATGTPEWASGVYDGAVHVVEEPGIDFGVRVSTLRHEIMHAQLHTGVGCMPAWFNEGAAQYFAGRPPVATWIAMLRERAAFDFDALSVPTIAEAPKEDAPLLYAQSLAMLLFVMDRADGLQDVVQTLHEIERPDARLRARTLWKTLSPSTTAGDVRAALARRMFGPAPELELESLVAGPVCCTGERRITELSCRPAGEEQQATGGDGLGPAMRCRPY